MGVIPGTFQWDKRGPMKRSLGPARPFEKFLFFVSFVLMHSGLSTQHTSYELATRSNAGQGL